MDISKILPRFDLRYVSTITKETKKESYNYVLTNLGERQKQVFNYLLKTFVNGASAKELSVAMYNDGVVPSPERNSVHPRLTELIEANLVKVIGKKTCQFTNRKVAIYKTI